MRVILHAKDGFGATIRVPSSKSHTHRALFIAALVEGKSRILEPLWADDTLATKNVIERFGAVIEKQLDSEVVVYGVTGPRWTPLLDCRESGTTLRIAYALASLLDNTTLVYGRGRLHQRPLTGLARALEQLGAKTLLSRECCPPAAVRGPLHGNKTSVDAWESSQYLTALLILGAALDGELVVKVERLSSKGYVDITLSVLKAFGVKVEREAYRVFTVKGTPKPTTYRVPGDWSSATPLLVLAAITNSRLYVPNLNIWDPHPDKRIVGVLERVGVKVRVYGDKGVEVEGGTKISSFEVCVDESPDLAPSLAVLAAAACGTSKVCCVERLRLKESDRLEAILELLKQASISARYTKGCIVVEGLCGSKRRFSRLSPAPDHRIVMMASLLATLSVNQVEISNAEAVRKSYPEYWTHLRLLNTIQLNIVEDYVWRENNQTCKKSMDSVQS